VVDTEDLSTLETAVTQAGLVDTLSGDGPFTVFAPTNEAFAAVPTKYLDPDYLPHLRNTLLFHVASDAAVLSTDLVDGQEITMANGEIITVSISVDSVTLTPALGGSATVVSADVMASNGVAHVIDAVLAPAFLATNLAELATASGLTLLVQAVVAAGLADTISSADSSLTVLAPTDAAFFSVEGVAEILQDQDLLTSILLYHVFEGIISSSELTTGTVTPLNMIPLGVDVSDDSVVFTGANSANVVTADVLANNGIVHVIDAVLLPPQDATAAPAAAGATPTATPADMPTAVDTPTASPVAMPATSTAVSIQGVSAIVAAAGMILALVL
jgi:uncharacterized surface protein with fasciclin (FAS1) repeats